MKTKYKALPLFRIFELSISADASWLILALIVVSSLATVVFPLRVEVQHPLTYWLMGAATAVILFGSIVLHELSHAIVARSFGVTVHNMTLFMFGGVTEIEDEAPTPKAEVFIALAGPLFSFVIGFIFLLCSSALTLFEYPEPLVAVLSYSSLLNFALGVFNLIPAYPLDGGRILRAVLWKKRHDMIGATRTAARAGIFFGSLMIIIGALSAFIGNLVGGLWWILLGTFLRATARRSFEQLILMEALQDKPISHLMHQNFVTVSPDLSIQELIDNFLYRHQTRSLPVVDNGVLQGYVSVDEIKDVGKDHWANHKVKEYIRQFPHSQIVSPHTGAYSAFKIMSDAKNAELLVADQGVLRGIVSLKDILGFLMIKLEVETHENLVLA